MTTHKSTTLTLAAGDVLRISGASGDSVRVTSRKTNPATHTFNGSEPDAYRYGPFAHNVDFTIEMLAGNPTWTTGTGPFETQISRIKSARVIATALNEGKQAMALVDKFKTIAARSRTIPKSLEARADALSARLDAVEVAGDKAFAGHEDFLTGVESGVAAAEDALAQLTNGAPQ